jgi:hypothetical protein
MHARMGNLALPKLIAEYADMEERLWRSCPNCPACPAPAQVLKVLKPCFRLSPVVPLFPIQTYSIKNLASGS